MGLARVVRPFLALSSSSLALYADLLLFSSWLPLFPLVLTLVELGILPCLTKFLEVRLFFVTQFCEPASL